MNKTERFELRLDQNTIHKIDDWRERQSDNPTRSEAARRLMERGLNEKIGVSGGERLILALLHELHKHHGVKGEFASDFVMEALYGGHHWAFEWELQGLFHGSLDRDQSVREVVDFLDMWSFLEEAYEGFSKAEKDKIEKETSYSGGVKFLGFDGNNETEHRGIALFMTEKMGRFERFKGRDLNSHMPSIEVYRRMYSVFEDIRTRLVGRTMTADEVVTVMNERVHPSNR